MANVFYKDYTPLANFKNANKPTLAECREYLVSFLHNFSIFKPDALEDLKNYWEYCIIPKNEMVVIPGKICGYIYFICRGAVKHFTQDDNGQHIVEFKTDCNFFTGLKSFNNQVPAEDGYICTKNTYALRISHKKYTQLITKYPASKKLFSDFSEKTILNILNRLASFQSTDAKGRYELMLSQHPDVFEKFTMQDISNYLGIKAETLSRLKKEIDKE